MEEYINNATDVLLEISERHHAVLMGHFFYEDGNFRITFSIIQSKLMRKEINSAIPILNQRLIAYNLQLQRCVSGPYGCWCEFEIVG